MENPLVSIIIPAYNAEKYIEETLRSTLLSSYTPIEIVVVDDGSDDATSEIVKSYAQKHGAIHFHTQSNSGVSAARNNAIRNSNGKYILPLDADDLISSDYIEKAVSVLESKPDVKLVYGAAEFFGERTGRWKLPDFDISLLAKRNIVYASGIYRRKDFDKTGGYCVDIAGLEDWDFWISLLKEGGEVHFIDSVCFYYRIRKNSKRSNDMKKKKQVVDTLNSRHSRFFQEQLGGKLHYNRSWSVLLNKLRIKCL